MTPESTTPTITIRFDDAELKKRIDSVAGAEGMSVTQFVIQTLRKRVETQCDKCGRTAISSLPGFAPALDTFLEEARKDRTPLVIMTFDGQARRSYRCGLNEGRQVPTPGSGALSVGPIDEGSRMTQGLIQIPRGLIIGWEFDPDGRRHAANLREGYVDGFEKAKKR